MDLAVALAPVAVFLACAGLAIKALLRRIDAAIDAALPSPTWL
jgi:hypothetical protein